MEIDYEKTLYFIPTFPEIPDKNWENSFLNSFFIIVFGEADNKKN